MKKSMARTKPKNQPPKEKSNPRKKNTKSSEGENAWESDVCDPLSDHVT
jgi:hypothetical protein